jgi:hypothetical protein
MLGFHHYVTGHRCHVAKETHDEHGNIDVNTDRRKNGQRMTSAWAIVLSSGLRDFRITLYFPV